MRSRVVICCGRLRPRLRSAKLNHIMANPMSPSQLDMLEAILLNATSLPPGSCSSALWPSLAVRCRQRYEMGFGLAVVRSHCSSTAQASVRDFALPFSSVIMFCFGARACPSPLASVSDESPVPHLTPRHRPSALAGTQALEAPRWQASLPDQRSLEFAASNSGKRPHLRHREGLLCRSGSGRRRDKGSGRSGVENRRSCPVEVVRAGEKPPAADVASTAYLDFDLIINIFVCHFGVLLGRLVICNTVKEESKAEVESSEGGVRGFLSATLVPGVGRALRRTLDFACD